MVVLAAFVAIAGVLGYAAVRSFRAAPAAAIEKLNIAVPMAPHAALLFIAAAKGYFAEEGIEAAILPVTHGRAALDLLIEGKADFACATEVPFVIALLRGKALAIAASVLSVPTRNAIVARRDRGIAAPGDLAGKKIGVTPGTNGEYFLWAFMIRHRLAPESVTLVNVAPGDTARALASGAVDATSTWPPIVLEAQSALGANAAVFVQPDAYTETLAVIGHSEFLRTHPFATRAMVRALLKAERFSQAAPEEALRIVAKRLGFESVALRPVLENLRPRVDLRQSHLITMEDQARWAMARGHAASGPVPNFLPHLHLDALLAVRPERVTVLH